MPYRERRDAVRETWGKDKSRQHRIESPTFDATKPADDFRVFFVVGKVEDQEVMKVCDVTLLYTLYIILSVFLSSQFFKIHLFYDIKF